MKRESRILGIDDSPFTQKDSEVLLVGALYRGGEFMDGLLSTKVSRDGDDSTRKIVDMVQKTKFRLQLRAIMLDGINVAGFNIMDITQISMVTSIPVLAIMREHPDLQKIESALIRLNMQSKISLIGKAGEIFRAGELYFQVAGMEVEAARSLILTTITHSKIPEPLRIAHIIASGIVNGESRGRA